MSPTKIPREINQNRRRFLRSTAMTTFEIKFLDPGIHPFVFTFG